MWFRIAKDVASTAAAKQIMQSASQTQKLTLCGCEESSASVLPSPVELLARVVGVVIMSVCGVVECDVLLRYTVFGRVRSRLCKT